MNRIMTVWIVAAAVVLVLASNGQAKKKPFADTDRDIRLYTITVDLTNGLLQRHSELPMFSCVSSFLPNFMNAVKPNKAIQYEAVRLKMAAKLKKLDPRKAERQILLKIPDACEGSDKAKVRLKKLKHKLLTELETILATSILVLEKHEVFDKAKKYRRLYRRYYPKRNLEKEFEKRYL